MTQNRFINRLILSIEKTVAADSDLASIVRDFAES